MKAALLASYFMLLLLQVDPGGAESYEYAEESEFKEVANVSDGDRLVGGRVTNTRKFPFMVGWNWYGFPDTMACTGSLITPTYFVSAAHCNMILQGDKDRIEEHREECVEATKKYGKHTITVQMLGGMKYTLKCRRLKKSQAFEIVAEPPGKAWLGMNNINFKRTNPEAEMVDIKRHIRHADTYRGGGTYGHFGGHDITLLEMKRPIVGFKKACLPSPSMDDLREHQPRDDTMLAGYGKFHRSKGRTCETNRFGPMKFHYCDKSHGLGQDACYKGPPPQHEECDSFFDQDDTPDTVPSNKEEIRIKRKGHNDVLCYPKHNPMNYERGWCHTKGNYYVLGREQERSRERSWGFCGDECFQDENIADSGILRFKDNIHVLSEKLCEHYVDASLFQTPQVRPRIMCVANQNKWKEEVYVKEGNGYRKVKQHGETERYGDTSYVASVGTCQGDSGGPAFVEEKPNHFVVTGLVSGGRGALGECGGINNPIHYVRFKKFTRWVIMNIQSKARRELCWNVAFEDRLAKMRKERRKRRKQSGK